VKPASECVGTVYFFHSGIRHHSFPEESMREPKVFLTGSDNMRWALETDISQVRQSLNNIVEFTSLDESEVVHCIWWERLLGIPRKQLLGKKIICHFPGEPFRYLTIPRHRHVVPMVGQWVTQSSQAYRQLRSIGVDSMLISYTVDLHVFRKIPPDDSRLSSIAERYNIPRNCYLIGNFHRDTEGVDLESPKLMKGPDIFLEIVKSLVRRGHQIHVVLAGPRRFWIRRQLENFAVPYTYVGTTVPPGVDDIERNVLPPEDINALLNLIDLYVVSSRSEGGPRTLLEAAAAKCKVISTPVGIASDIVGEECIYSSVRRALAIVEDDICSNSLESAVETHYNAVVRNHSTESVAPLFRQLYDRLEAIPALIVEDRRHVVPKRPTRRGLHILSSVKRFMVRRKTTIGAWHNFTKPPYGGGNQFMLALEKELQQRDIRVERNAIRPEIEAYVLNSIHFNVEKFLKLKKDKDIRVIHRIDGPISLARGFDREKDALCFRLNQEIASATVLQSNWTYQRIVEMGYQPVKPVVVHNAVDPDIFHKQGRVPFDRNRKIRLISTSWSDNTRKGGAIYKWIEENLDWNRFEYTFVGRVSEEFEFIRHIPPVSSQKLAQFLRQHDIYITAGQNDSCSNALIEALSCGLPALYLASGGHAELVGYGGLPFHDTEEILPQLDALVDDYETFQNLISVPSLTSVTNKYLDILRDISFSGRNS